MESVVANRAVPIGGITLSDRGGSRRTRAEPPKAQGRVVKALAVAARDGG